ncbi:MAG: hypothetical protein D9C04_04530 [Nitrosopumilus sp. B06]|nr:MAG: hypothetical protein EB828_00530 [Nitrosopumilus sp. D6]RNJ79484.1 MAG: hypothetical protein D9C04_04530 [Nitrosopumilus sp. B06]
MNPKVFVGAAAVALVILLGIILVDPFDIPGPGDSGNVVFQPIEIKLGDIEVTKISQRSATILLSFEIVNPNPGAVRVQVLDYQLYETGYSESEQISGGQIGSRPTGMVEFGSNYYTLLGEGSIILKDDIQLKNTGNTPELWARLGDGTSSWLVSGDVFYNRSSVTSGQENELHFVFEK